MKKIKYILILCLFTFFVPKVYALSYDIKMNSETLVKVGTKKDINISIFNVKDTTDGISVCTMNISFDKNIELESTPRTLGSWSMTTGSVYLFDTGSPVTDNSDMFKIPVVVNGVGSVQLKNIVCSDGVDEVEIDGKTITFSIEKEEVNQDNSDNKPNVKPSDKPSNNNQEDNNEDEEIISNCNLANIELSEGIIEFDPNITEYEVEISNFDNFKVYPTLEDENAATYIIDKNVTDDGGNIVITVSDADGENKIYTIHTIVEKEKVEEPVKNNNYVPIFIGIIVLLLLVNVIRIVKSSKNK